MKVKRIEETAKNIKSSANNCSSIEKSFEQKCEKDKIKCQDLIVKLRFATSQVSLLKNKAHEYSKRNVDIEKMKAASMFELDNMMKDNHRLQEDISLDFSVMCLFKVKNKEENNRITTLEEPIAILKDDVVAQKNK